MALPEITEDVIRNLANEISLNKGYRYFHGGAVVKVCIEKDSYKAHVDGSELYTVTISGDKGAIQTDCTCPYDWGGACKHVVAALLAICHDKKIRNHNKDVKDIRTLIEKTDSGRLKEFLFRILSGDAALLEDFRIFARGKEETGDTHGKYKKEMLSQLNKLKGIEYYYDDYHDSYEHPISDIVDKYSETAKKYTAQENYKEAIKIYQGICDACIESLRNERLEDFYDDIHFAAQESFKSMAENIQRLSDKKLYLDYLLHAYVKFEDKEVFKDVFLKIVNSPEEANYVHEKSSADLFPPITLNLFIVKGEPETVFSFGEKHYREYPEMAAPLSAFYLKNNMRDKAIATAEKALEIIQGKSRDFRFGFHLSDHQKDLREFLHGCYVIESDYPKIVENLIMLIDHERDIAYYKKLEKIIKTEEEKHTIIERLEKLLDSDYDLLFKIYSLESDYEKLLRLAGDSIQFDVFHLIVKSIRDRYPVECFELYKKKINRFTEDVKKRDAYREVAYWLKLMKEVPGMQEKFRRYIEHLREKYRRRPAFIDEIKCV
jgi:tetratricopeptide (TPR) repeat protein